MSALFCYQKSVILDDGGYFGLTLSLHLSFDLTFQPFKKLHINAIWYPPVECSKTRLFRLFVSFHNCYITGQYANSTTCLQKLISNGIGVHSGTLTLDNRRQIESLFRGGWLSVLCLYHNHSCTRRESSCSPCGCLRHLVVEGKHEAQVHRVYFIYLASLFHDMFLLLFSREEKLVTLITRRRPSSRSFGQV